MRAAALVALVLMLGIALRGHLPGAQPAQQPRPAAGPAGLLGVLALVIACLLVIVVSIVAKLREPNRARPAARHDVPGGAGARVRRSPRFLLIIAAGLLAWLLVVVLLAQWRLPQPGPDRPAGPAGDAPAGPPPPGSDTGPPPSPPEPGAVSEHLVWSVVIAMAVLLVVVLVGGVVLRVRERRGRTPTPLAAADPGPDAAATRAGSLALAAERGLAEVGDLRREPRDAIIACYAAMEDALAGAPGAAPQESDTPSEVLARAVAHEAIHAERATELVNLFAEARFSTHVMNEGHREAAERALRGVLDELRSPV
ncbi:DUF4129 domain-containing protein [Mycobacterium sp. shizuoka-1]|uniref:DUF4129 domain-containing protein n=1 Tax=Mycobacterium sp. shizuoka-1 TaxID=2039281 RepID=UPI001E2BB541|nr:DUF4129 domain-containing protein [Mycobacterium sp. shizuoka-1]